MGMQIEDGTGDGYSAKVDSVNRLKTLAVNESIEHEINHDNGLCFNLMFEVNATSANNCVLYLKNSSEKDIVMEGVAIRSGTTAIPGCDIKFYVNDTGTPSGTTSIVPANLNAASGQAASGDFYSGAAIASLARGTRVHRLWITSLETKNHNFEADIIIPKNKVFTMCPATSGVSLVGNIVFFYDDK